MGNECSQAGLKAVLGNFCLSESLNNYLQLLFFLKKPCLSQWNMFPNNHILMHNMHEIIIQGKASCQVALATWCN